MAKHTDVGTSIEGSSLSLQTRKYLPKPPEKDSKLGKVVYPFKLTIFGIARIAAELNPKLPLWSLGSKLDHGDELHGESIFGRSEKPLGKPSVVNATGSHKATALATRGRSFAKIEVGVRSLLQRKAVTEKQKE